MHISKVNKNYNIYIIASSGSEEFKVKIDTIKQNFKKQSLIDSVLCFKNEKINIDGNLLDITWPNTMTYKLCVEHGDILSYWDNIKIKPLKNNIGYAAIVDSTESIDVLIKPQIKENYKVSATIKYVTAISILTAVCLVMLSHTNILNNTVECDSYSPYAEACSVSISENKDEGILTEAIIDDSSKNTDIKPLPEEAYNDSLSDDDKTIVNEESENSYTLTQTAFEGKDISYLILDNDIYTPKLVLADSYASVSSLVTKGEGIIGINASAWNTSGEMDFTYVDGQWISDTNDAYVADPLVFANGNLSTMGYDFVNKSMVEKANPTWVLTGYNGVIFNKYSTNSDWNEEYNRSFIGQLSNGDYVIGIIENATYQDMIGWARNMFGYNIDILYNLDGGESCGLVVDDKTLYKGRNVKTAIIF